MGDDTVVCDIGILRPNGWKDQDATWYAGRPEPMSRSRVTADRPTDKRDGQTL